MYMVDIGVRWAGESEIEWINGKYHEVDFLPSNFDTEVIAVAELDGQRVGLGRLIAVDKGSSELGGMYVFEGFRGHGVAKRIIEFLLRSELASQDVYCIAFQHLISFYEKSGFIYCTHFDSIPKKILNKYEWCKNRYPTPPRLLVRSKNIPLRAHPV